MASMPDHAHRASMHRQPRRGPGGVTPETRATVLGRDLWRCTRCGGPLDSPIGYSLQHRRARGMGGSRREDTNLPGNLIALCGSATTGCHGRVESKREEALAAGYTITQSQDPLEVPVETWRGVLYLDHTGGFRYADRLIPDAPTEGPF